ncbi:hypothetical protein [Bdellovibrio sp. HCB337]|uniref:hypothetical protein n=1 Tax=Bdellovibrio sp. HCB337 TaxID=3394358 RepID=UPI0039A5F71A
MKTLVLLLVSFSSLAQAKVQRAQFESSIRSPYDYSCNYREGAPQINKGVQGVDFEVEPNQKTLSIKKSVLATGNCVGAELPPVLQLQEGELLETPVNIQGVPPMTRSTNTVFYARWERPSKNTIRIYGGCSWAYTCGGMTGYSDIQFTVTTP